MNTIDFDFDYTTPEQSQKLIDLGVPTWTADGDYYYSSTTNVNDVVPEILARDEHYEDWSSFGEIVDYLSLPCWSVGRLIQLITKCSVNKSQIVFTADKSPIQTICDDLAMCIERQLIDFNKLKSVYNDKGRNCREAT